MDYLSTSHLWGNVMTCILGQWGMFILVFDTFYSSLITFSGISYSAMMAINIVTCLCDLSPLLTPTASPASIATLMTCHMVHRPSSETSMLYSSHHSTNAPTTWSIPLLVSCRYNPPVLANVACRMQVFEDGTSWAKISAFESSFCISHFTPWPRSFAMTIPGILKAY